MKNKIIVIGSIGFILVILLFIYIYRQNNQENIDRPSYTDTKKEITIVNSDFRSVPFYLTTGNTDEYIVTSDSVCKLEKQGTWIELKQHLKREPLYWLRNGKEYHIVGYNRVNGWIKFDSKDAEACHEANFFCWLDSCRYEAQPLISEYVFKQGKYLNRDSLICFGEEDYRQNCRILQEYALKYPVSDLFIRYCKEWFALNNCNAKYLAFMRALRLNDTVKGKVYKLLLQQDSVLFRKDHLLFTSFYKKMTIDYSRFLVTSVSGKEKKSGIDFYRASEHFFKEGTRDYALYMWYQAMMASQDKNRDCIDFFSDCRNESYHRMIREKLMFEENVNKFGSQYLMAMDGQVFAWADLLKKWKGKVVYVDCWASWCEPCRALLPASHALAAAYDAKDVVFVYLSLDTDAVKWRKACEAERLLTGENYCVLHPGEFRKQWAIASIPHYILLDQKGELFLNCCPRPDNFNIRKTLDSLLYLY